MQMQMLVTNTEKCYFFNYLVEDATEMWHELVIERDENTINLIKQRIDFAENIKQDYVKLLKQNQQF